MELLNKVAIVTGGASGLGLATVQSLVEKKAKVVIFDVNEEVGKAACRELRDNVIFVNVDVTNSESVSSGIQKAMNAFGAIHICVNCAGIASAEKTVGKKGPMPLERFKKVVDINLIGTFDVLRLAAAEMAKNEPLDEIGERGVIINTASGAAFEGQMGQAAYSATKAGIVGMTLPIARDLSSLGIRINTIAPGLFLTPLAAGTLPSGVIKKLESMIEFPKRLGNPSEFAALVVHIAENAYFNGETVRLDAALRLFPR